MSDHYSILGLKRNCTLEDINKAYRKNVKKWHPDRCTAPNAAEMFQRVEEAHKALSRPKKIDVSGVKKRPGMTVVRFSSTNTDDMMEKISQITQPAPKLRVRPDYKPKSKPKSTPMPEPKPKPKPTSEPKPINPPTPSPAVAKPDPKPESSRPTPVTEDKPPKSSVSRPILKPILKPESKPDPDPEPDVESIDEGIEIPLNCTLEEVYTGKKRIIKTPQGKAVIVTIPQGCEQGHQIDVINPDTDSTDKFIVNIQKHAVFERTHTDLYMTHQLSLEEFINGFSVQVTLLNDKKKKISHKYSGKTIGPELEMKVKGMGMPIPNSYPETFGDLYIRFKIMLPATYPATDK